MPTRDDEKGYVTYCGTYCGACSHRLTGETNDPRHMSPRAETLDPVEIKYWTSCPGCRAGGHRADCDIRICASSKGLGHCIDCDGFPCQRHREFNSDGVPHHAGSLASLAMLKEKGELAWLDLQRMKWTCGCGASLSWYLRHCIGCGHAVGRAPDGNESDDPGCRQ